MVQGDGDGSAAAEVPFRDPGVGQGEPDQGSGGPEFQGDGGRVGAGVNAVHDAGFAFALLAVQGPRSGGEGEPGGGARQTTWGLTVIRLLKFSPHSMVDEP